MYGIIPGAGNGIELGGPANIAATGTASDAITVVYADYAFPLNQYTHRDPSREPAGRYGHISRRRRPPPAGFPAIQSPTGIQVGDLILFTNNLGSAVGEVTGIAPGAGTSTDISFANGDPLKINQTGAAKREHQVHHWRRGDHRHPHLGGHLFHRSSCRRDQTAAPPDAPGQRTDAGAGSRQHYQPQSHL